MPQYGCIRQCIEENIKQKIKMNRLIAISGKKNSGKDTVAKIIQYLIARESDKRSIKVQTMEFLGLNENNWLTINNQQNYKIKRFADPIKDYVCILLGCTREQLEDRDFKEKELGEEWWYYKGETGLFPYNTPYEANKKLPLIKHTPRSLMINVAETLKKTIHPDIWCNALFSNYVDSDVEIRKDIGKTYKNVKPIKPIEGSKWVITDLRFKNELEAVKKRDGIVIRVNREVESDNHISETELDSYKDWDFVINNNGTIEDLIKEVKRILIRSEII